MLLSAAFDSMYCPMAWICDSFSVSFFSISLCLLQMSLLTIWNFLALGFLEWQVTCLFRPILQSSTYCLTRLSFFISLSKSDLIWSALLNLLYVSSSMSAHFQYDFFNSSWILVSRFFTFSKSRSIFSFCWMRSLLVYSSFIYSTNYSDGNLFCLAIANCICSIWLAINVSPYMISFSYSAFSCSNFSVNSSISFSFYFRISYCYFQSQPPSSVFNYNSLSISLMSCWYSSTIFFNSSKSLSICSNSVFSNSI